MALKSWQMNKTNNAPQKKGQGNGKPAAKKAANEKQAQGIAQNAEARPETATLPETMTPTPVTIEHAEPHSSEEPAGEIKVICEPIEADGVTAETPDLPVVEVKVEQIEPEVSETAHVSEPEAEAVNARPAPAAQTETATSMPVQPEPTTGEAGAEAEVIAVPEETQMPGEAQVPGETRAVAPALAEPDPAGPAPIVEAGMSTEQPAAATEPTTSAGTVAESEAKSASRKTQPRERDPRLPPPGTVLQRRDRHGNVRCECTVEQDGIRYAGKLYKSLSAAAIAATKDMGLKSKTQNGHTFWGVAKPARPAKSLLESLERSWERYRQHAEAVAAQSTAGDEERASVRQAIERHTQTLSGLRARVA